MWKIFISLVALPFALFYLLLAFVAGGKKEFLFNRKHFFGK
jgi:hypothetical protein